MTAKMSVQVILALFNLNIYNYKTLAVQITTHIAIKITKHIAIKITKHIAIKFIVLKFIVLKRI
jgi:hypothetical protein